MDRRTGLPVVGMVGGGPFARMTHQAAITLGQSLRLLASRPDDAAALVAADVVVADFTRPESVRGFAQGCDVVTSGEDQFPTGLARSLAADGVTVRPGPEALRLVADKGLMRERLAGIEVPVARGESPAELAVIVARSPWGQVAAYPTVRIARRGGICAQVLAPASDLDEDAAVAAQRLAIRVAKELDVVGVLAAEFTEAPAGPTVADLRLGPGAPGLWSIEGARTSQFEQHLRAVLDYPLGPTALTAPAVATATILQVAQPKMGLDERVHHLYGGDPGARVHLYGTLAGRGGMIGHVTVLGDDPAQVRARARAAATWLGEGRG